MKKEELELLLSGKSVKVGTKNNKISLHDNLFLVELYVPGIDEKEELFEVADAYLELGEAIAVAKRHTPASFTLSKFKY